MKDCHFIQPVDSAHYTNSASCGGKIPLSYSSPYATYSSPYYHQNSTNSVFMNCNWYVTGPPGEQVHLSLVDMEILDGHGNLRVSETTYPTYTAAYMYGSLNSITNILSSQGSLDINCYHYYSNDQFHGGHGVHFQTRIMGKNLTLFTFLVVILILNLIVRVKLLCKKYWCYQWYVC